MKYLLLCALVIAGAFFSPVYANPDRCPEGGTFQVIDGIEMCTEPAPVSTYAICTSSHASWSIPVKTSKVPNIKQPYPAVNCTDSANALVQSTIGMVPVSGWVISSCPSPTIEAHPSGDITRASGSANCTMTHTSRPDINPPRSHIVSVVISSSLSPNEDYYCPPDNKPGFIKMYPVGEAFVCWKDPAPFPECDCANFAGQSLNTRNTLRAPKGQYTNENPPQCVMQQEFVAGRDTPLTCTCQVSAQKWMKTNSGFENGVEYERWETLPTTQGQPSGTFTGVKCGATDGGPLEPENNAPKECFTLPNGVRWCWADKAEKCQVVNGVEQCASGCGTVNGDFVCYDDKPVIPPKDRDQLTPPDDTLTDPNKPINEMVKSDFKEVNKGVETRLDNVVTSISNATIAMDEVSDKVGLTNSKLDGIGMQLDGVGKQLGAIDGKLEGAFGDKGQPMPGTGDGETCYEDICSWYESAYPDGLVGIWQERSADLQQTPLFDFLNQLSTVAPTGGQPDFNICFNLGAMGDYGCKSFEIPSAIWAFIRLIIFISAGIFCYRIVSGV